MASKLTVFVLSVVIAVAAAQDSAGGAEARGDEAGWTGSEQQIRGKHCGQLTRDDCTFIDECRQHCPQTCSDRDNGATPAPENRPLQQQNQPSNGHPKKKGCFHGDDMVQTKEYGTISISRLAELRDAHVLTRNDDGEMEYSPVRYWLHAQANMHMKFLTLQTATGNRLSLTSEHLIYETDCQGGAGRAIYAKNVKVGRCLYVNENGRLVESPVVEKGEEKMQGIYSPITTTGSIVVNDVLASCYNYYENEALQKFVYQYMIGFQEFLASWLPTSLYEAAFNSQNGEAVAVPRLILNFLQLSDVFVH